MTSDGATPAVINASDYIKDPDGDVLIFTATGLPPGLVIDPNTGTISGTIDKAASQTGPFTVTITGTDPSGAATTTSVTYTVTNLVPVAVDDVASSNEDTIQTGNVLSDPLSGDHDTAPDSDPLTVTAVTGGTIGAPQALTLSLIHI